MLGRIFFDLSAACSLLALVVHFRLYRQFSKGSRLPRNSKEAYEFVEHTALALWFFLGVVLVGLVGVSPWWLMLWFGLGGLAAFIVERLIVIGGLGIFISAGEQVVRNMSMGRAAESSFIAALMDEATNSEQNSPGAEF